MSEKEAVERGYKKVEVPLMGDYRFYLCLPYVLSEKQVAEKAPCHGLIYLDGRVMKIIRPALKRKLVDKNAEIRYLRFAIINGKIPFGQVEL